MSQTTQPVALALNSIFSDSKYVIPLYQRNYAWEEAQVSQLIQDIWDYSIEVKKSKYYIGTLVTFKRDVNNEYLFETIDGQQRLTTINILLSVLKREYDLKVDYQFENNLKFDSRKSSTETLLKLAKNTTNHAKYNSKMLEAYATISKTLKKIINNNKTNQAIFIEYLLNKVELLRVEVPFDTDLNHYFEIMNNRGEQLEKHEIVKATLLKYLKEDKESSYAFNLIWEACSNMERYVQYGLKKDLRDKIFKKDWGELPIDFESVKNISSNFRPKENSKESTEEESKDNTNSFLSVLQNDKVAINKFEIDNEDDTRFSTIISFPNFLLHTLRIFSGKDIPLDDKRLIITFDNYLDSVSDKAQFVKDFGYALLKTKFLFDNYIIKRDYSKKEDEWSLKKIKFGKQNEKPYYTGTFENTSQNKQLIMLLSMFHVSFPQAIYKHWLNGVLLYLYNNYSNKKTIESNAYINYLEQMSDAFYFDRFGWDEKEYFDIIFTNKCKLQNNVIDVNNLHKGTEVQNFIFNRLDYLLWKSIEVKKENKFRIDKINKFEFTTRSSVEHYYPQNPKQGADLKFEVGKEFLDQFGNLCLISRSKNSELSNYSPIAKAEHYGKSSTIESLKQQLMMAQKDKWNEEGIIKHQKEMIALLEVIHTH